MILPDYSPNYQSDLATMLTRLLHAENEVKVLRKEIDRLQCSSPAKWREFIVPFDPAKYGEHPWAEVVVAIGCLAMPKDSDHDIHRALSRIVSICEYVCGEQMEPVDDVPWYEKTKQSLYIRFIPEGTQEDAVYQQWCYGELGTYAATWLRSLYE